MTSSIIPLSLTAMNPGQSRWSASVVSGGTVNPGDGVSLA